MNRLIGYLALLLGLLLHVSEAKIHIYGHPFDIVNQGLGGGLNDMEHFNDEYRMYNAKQYGLETNRFDLHPSLHTERQKKMSKERRHNAKLYKPYFQHPVGTDMAFFQHRTTKHKPSAHKKHTTAPDQTTDPSGFARFLQQLGGHKQTTHSHAHAKQKHRVAATGPDAPLILPNNIIPHMDATLGTTEGPVSSVRSTTMPWQYSELYNNGESPIKAPEPLVYRPVYIFHPTKRYESMQNPVPLKPTPLSQTDFEPEPGAEGENDKSTIRATKKLNKLFAQNEYSLNRDFMPTRVPGFMDSTTPLFSPSMYTMTTPTPKPFTSPSVPTPGSAADLSTEKGSNLAPAIEPPLLLQLESRISPYKNRKAPSQEESHAKLVDQTILAEKGFKRYSSAYKTSASINPLHSHKRKSINSLLSDFSSNDLLQPQAFIQHSSYYQTPNQNVEDVHLSKPGYIHAELLD